MWVRTRGMFDRNYRYGDLTNSRKAFLSYGIEAQASIVEDYFLVANHMKPRQGSGAIRTM